MNVEIVKGEPGKRPLWRTREIYKVRLGPWCNPRVPAGFVSNLGTIPRMPGIYWLVAPDDHPMEFILHDYMTNEDAHPDDGEELISGYSRWLADCVLYEQLQKSGAPAWKCWVIWAAVRAYARWHGLK